MLESHAFSIKTAIGLVMFFQKSVEQWKVNVSKQSLPISNIVSVALILAYTRDSCLCTVLLITIPLAI